MDKTDQEAHKRMAERRNAGYEAKQARATVEKGLLIINTGTGKGKSTAAFGMGLRAVGHGMKLGVVQFIKGAMHTAERELFQRFPNVEWHTIGEGFTWKTQDRERDVATARRAWAEAERMILDPSFDMVILDELNVILKYDYLDLGRVLDVLGRRKPMLHVIITGRHAPEKLIEAADLVSDIRPLKHPYKDQGVKAQRGVEF
ncbi:MAG TPA: cob(I)yrinic acid a,c-diamide adenosyltransferase [Candidatus Competibacteraceae bacterium]|nr:cob(I)yrinic acid a,c-diamide adenosyltransferase [Candidatus Competibacteraceae bacterium]